MIAGCLSRFGKNASRRGGGEDQNFGVHFHLHHFWLYIHPSDLLLGWGRNGGMSTFEIEELRQGEKDLFQKDEQSPLEGLELSEEERERVQLAGQNQPPHTC